VHRARQLQMGGIARSGGSRSDLQSGAPVGSSTVSPPPRTSKPGMGTSASLGRAEMSALLLQVVPDSSSAHPPRPPNTYAQVGGDGWVGSARATEEAMKRLSATMEGMQVEIVRQQERQTQELAGLREMVQRSMQASRQPGSLAYL
jgi:hypothetical protein